MSGPVDNYRLTNPPAHRVYDLRDTRPAVSHPMSRQPAPRPPDLTVASPIDNFGIAASFVTGLVAQNHESNRRAERLAVRSLIEGAALVAALNYVTRSRRGR